MKFLRGLVVFFLVLIILGGLGYIGYNVFMGEIFQTRIDMTPKTQAQDMNGMNMGDTEKVQNASLPNPYVTLNREKMNQAISLIDQALELITIDPYSRATIPDSKDKMQMDNMQGQVSKSTGTINIYPSDNSSVNITPSDIKT